MVHPWDKGENIHLDNFLFSVVHMRELELADKEWALDDSFGSFGSRTVFSKLSYNTFFSYRDHRSVFAFRPLHMLFPLPGTYFPVHFSFLKSSLGLSFPP